MSPIADTSAHPDVIRNQQVAGSYPAAGSNLKAVVGNDLGRVRKVPRWAIRTAQGAYQGAYRRLLAFFGYGPASRLQPFTDDLDTEQRVEELTRRLRG